MLKRFAILFLILTAGCSNSDRSPVPVPLRSVPPFTYQGKIGMAWGGDNFEVIEDGHIHCAIVRGIDTPKFGQEFFDQARNLIYQLTAADKATIEVIKRDAWQREICDIYIIDRFGTRISPAIMLLEQGLAWYDGNDLPLADQYIAAEASAREKKIGIWSLPSPVPPWEFWEQQRKKVQHGVRKAD